MNLIVGNYKVDAEIIDILKELRHYLAPINGKLNRIEEKRDQIKVTCPFHKNGHEADPSCNIFTGDSETVRYGTFHCFTCDESGSFEKFVAGCLDLPEEIAINWIISRFPSTKISTVHMDPPIKINRTPTKKYVKTIDKSILDTYQNWCPYLAKRGLSRETCRKYEVKYDSQNRQVVFPCYDVDGNLVMLHRRSIDTKMFYLDEDVNKPVFGLDKIVQNHISKAIVTEGPFDALKAVEFGFPACATLGNLDDDQINQINESGIKFLYIMFDNDAAGDKFKQKLKKSLKKTIWTYEPKFPSNRKDIGELTYEEFWNSINNCK